ncbi:unnamed protein product [Brassica oleracea]
MAPSRNLSISLFAIVCFLFVVHVRLPKSLSDSSKNPNS